LSENFATFAPDRPPELRSNRCAALVQYWTRLCGARAYPSWSEIDPVQLKAILPNVMVVGIEHAPFRALYRLVGTEIVRFAKLDFTGHYADELTFQDEDGEDWTRFYREVVEAHRPGAGRVYWISGDPMRRWVEFVICPLSSDGETIDRCISLEDYEPFNLVEIDVLPAVMEV
jgi:hypothetical protein